jgi:hypothetical protein
VSEAVAARPVRDGGGGLVVGHPKKRERLAEEGAVRHPWREDPSLSSRSPFEPGNEMSMVHGAFSERRLAPLAEQLAEEIVIEAPWTARPAFQAAVTAWAWSEAACQKYRDWFETHDLFDADGEPTAGLVRWDRTEARAAAMRKRLALDPAALGSLLSKLTTVEGSGGTGTLAQTDMQALRNEIRDLDEQIAEALEAKELERG